MRSGDTRRRPAGFTLIELLVVLTIVASLLMLSLPRYMRALDSAAQTVLTENLRLTRDAAGTAAVHLRRRRSPAVFSLFTL